jgi:MFS transporter, DHA1 family, inner membrane transport protein
MTIGNLIGGRLADGHPSWELVIGYSSALMVLVLLAVRRAQPWLLMLTLFGVGTTMMMAIPTIQVWLTRAAPKAPARMGALNLAALNVANAMGAWSGAHAIASSHGLLSAAWAGFILTSLGILVFLFTLRRSTQLAAEVY